MVESGEQAGCPGPWPAAPLLVTAGVETLSGSLKTTSLLWRQGIRILGQNIDRERVEEG